MRDIRWWPLAACVLLGACGGGGGGVVASAGSAPTGGSSGGTSTGGTSAAANTSITALTASQSFANNAAATQVSFDLTTKTTISGSNASGPLTVSYDATTKSYSLASGSQSQQFAPADLNTSSGGEARYQKTGGSPRDYLTLVTTPYTSSTSNQYVGLGYWQRNVLSGTRQDTYFSTFVYGLDTPASAVPRIGTASWTIDVFGLASTPGYEPRTFEGSGTFSADLGNGVFSAHAYTTETGLLSGNGITGGGVDVTAAGHLASGDGQFSGNALYSGTNGRIAGSINGRFFGPGAQEIGAAFGGSNADGATFAGAFTGRRDAATQLVNQTLTNLVTNQLFYTREADLTYTSFDNDVSPPQVRSTTMISQFNQQNAETFSYGPGRSDLPGGAWTATAQVASTDPNFTSYKKTFAGQDVFLDLYKPGSGNTELALTYASFGRWRSSAHNGVVTTADRVYFAYGLETPGNLLDAKTGKAHYAGVAYGAAANQTTHAQYDVKGTSSFDVDFSAQSLAATLALKGTSTVGGTDLDFGSFTFNGKLGSYTGETVATYVVGTGQYGSLSTRFYGPDGEEVAGPFTLTVPAGRPGEQTYVVGVAAAKRQ